RELLGVTDLFLPNAEEAIRIGGTHEPREAATTLATHGPLTAVQLGAAGAPAPHPNGHTTGMPGLAGAVPVDGVGAGDSLDAGFLTGLLNGLTIDRALALGCACGALSTQAIGGTSAQPTLPQALEAVESLTAARDSG